MTKSNYMVSPISIYDPSFFHQFHAGKYTSEKWCNRGVVRVLPGGVRRANKLHSSSQEQTFHVLRIWIFMKKVLFSALRRGAPHPLSNFSGCRRTPRTPSNGAPANLHFIACYMIFKVFVMEVGSNWLKQKQTSEGLFTLFEVNPNCVVT